ncbi:MAG: inorganic phosphate transporter [Flavobacteriaceae bacterium]|nr:inorganic phosphate transporter [Flavobacteriaceae bacterium]MDG1965355.1 inorganic phosphate transporter [Flavobacteriaceae bacterium]
MENIYLYIVILLSLLAIGDLIVGVSNDAVNFLNSAIGSKAISFRKIMIFASLGIALGALFSSGMMEVARKGIFNPGAFNFEEIIFIFMAVMMTDILLLDFFNTLGMPTSTTVSIVFELLGAAVVMSLIKIFSNSGNLMELSTYINTDKATQIILGILLSVFIAFTIGAVVQWISRALLTHDFLKKSNSINALFGGISLAAISNFILIKGIKGTPYAGIEYDFLSGQTINTFLEANALLVNLSSLLFWYLFSYILMKGFKLDIYKLIIGVGTFALALAFAGNDLVNFIGVPVAAYQSYDAWVASGMAANEFSMSVLSNKVPTPTLFLLGSGLIMVLTLWFSSKAKKVVKTSLDLSDQNHIKERFRPNFLSRILVRFFVGLNHYFSNLFPSYVSKKISVSFESSADRSAVKDINTPSFDTLRASINLTVAAILISIATSLKLPLSTTYVTFMVTMGTSLADRAWGSDSAVYRVAGVINVIGGWFFTALSAFLVCGGIVYLIHLGGFTAILIILSVILLLISRNFINHRRETQKREEERKLLSVQGYSYREIIEESSRNISNVIGDTYKIYAFIIKGLSQNDLKTLSIAKKNTEELYAEVNDLKNGIYYFLKRIKETNIPASRFYISLLGIMSDLIEDLIYISNLSHRHINNHHSPLKLKQIEDLNDIFESLSSVFKEGIEAFNLKFSDKEFNDVLIQKQQNLELLNQKIDDQITRTDKETSPKNTALYFNILIRTKDLILHKFDLVEEFYQVSKKVKS